MTLEIVQPDPAVWDTFVAERGGHILQTSTWGAFKRAFGWRDQIVALCRDGRLAAGALVLYRPLPLGLGTIAYVPRGPILDWDDEPLTDALLNTLDDAAAYRRAMALKLEPDGEDSPALRARLEALRFRPSPQTVQPPRTIVLDLTGTEDDILARMNQGTRRKIRMAARRGVAIRMGGMADLESFNALMQATGSRNAFGVHSPTYYRKVYELFADRSLAVLLMASYQGRDLAGIMVFALGARAWYFYGASSDEERERMPNYGLQWEAVRWARARGCTEYDLWGIPDEQEEVLEAQFQDRSDGLWGVYGFKRGFGGRVVRAPGAWDRVYNPLLYRAYALALGGAGTG
ncbi:MAG: peptidoglycan bridge formation glycyltransferase FemA/FemB family protein [Anaerolineae bacterium]